MIATVQFIATLVQLDKGLFEFIDFMLFNLCSNVFILHDQMLCPLFTFLF